MATIDFINHNNGDRVVVFSDPKRSSSVIPLTALQATAFAASLRQVATGTSKASVCPLGGGMSLTIARSNLKETEVTPETQIRMMLEVPTTRFDTPINTTQSAEAMLALADGLASQEG